MQPQNVGQGDQTWRLEARTCMTQSNYPEKILVFDRLKLIEETAHTGGALPGDVEYRLGYYVVSPTAGKWVWARSPLMIPADDLPRLLDKAHKEGTLI